MGLVAESEEPVVVSLYDKIAEVASSAVDKVAEKRSETPNKPVRVWDGMQAVWLLYEDYSFGRVEASLTLRPDDVRMLGKEDVAREFRLAAGSRAWRGDEHRPLWSSSERYSRIIESGVFEGELWDWIVESLAAALERAARELRPLSVAGKSARAPRPAAQRRAARAPLSAVSQKKEQASTKRATAAETTAAAKTPAKKTAAKKTPAKKTAAKSAAKKSAAKKTPAKKTAAKSAAKKSAAKKTPAKKTAAKSAAKSAAKKTPAKKTAAKSAAKKTPAKKTSAKSAAKKTAAKKTAAAVKGRELIDA
ncbi:hypothetical protein [Streptomyces canus]|uniref:hypothetical protein n=1 Tax=Streptomyces canus TaxID=58343 RepID=UPI0027843B86|nr:hypothetical protein [Streptomyces canus]MDQ0765357.1 chemotaxis protein histidine kinase CheA [Streptomyces canus]